MADESTPSGTLLHTLPRDFVIIDVETTGFMPGMCRIIEVAAIKVEGGVPVKQFEALVQTDDVIPDEVQALTGITPQMLQEEGYAEPAVMRVLDAMIGDSVLMAYNARFDMSFLQDSYMRTLGKSLGNGFVDLLPMARRALPDMRHHRMEDLCAELGIVNASAHRALADVRAELQCYARIRPMLIRRYGSEEAYGKSFRQRGSAGGRSSKRWENTVDDFVDQDAAIDESHVLYGKNVVFTGTLASLSRKDAKEAVTRRGGTPKSTVTQATDYVVIGGKGYTRAKNGESTKARKARQNAERGLPVRIISEDEFLEMIRE